MLKPILDNQWKKWQIILGSVLLFSHLLVFAVSARPVQDDYSLLADISEKGYIGYLSLVWETHGGNLTPMILNAVAISSALNSFNFFSISAFSILTFFLVGLAAWIVASQIRFNDIRLTPGVVVLLVFGTLFGFEGFFSPGLVGAYHFSSASAVHLWPLIFASLGLYLASKSSSSLYLIFAVGVFSGNSNIAESLAVILAIILLLSFPRKFSNELSLRRLRIFLSGLLIGAITIVASPGFWTRATENTEDGIPSSIPEFFIRLSKSVSVFTVDVVTHPALYIFFIFGYLFNMKFAPVEYMRLKWNYIEVLFLAMFFSLILGATFAYPAWHQSLGLLFLLPCASFVSGFRLGNRTKFLKPYRLSKLASVFLISLVLMIARADLLVLQSGSRWQDSNSANICALTEEGASALLSNPEIHYPIFGLGVEDVQTWPWIRVTYIRWISNIENATQIDCQLIS
jgi:hypothetical protein